jgi:hypothetical protein
MLLCRDTSRILNTQAPRRALEEFAAIGRDKSREGVPYEAVGDAKAAMRSAARVYRGEYRTRYIYHLRLQHTFMPVGFASPKTAQVKKSQGVGLKAERE